MTLSYFEDFKTGDYGVFGAYEVKKEEILEFAQAFDPQPFHLEEEAGARSMLGGLAASGWQTFAIMTRLYCDEWLGRAASMGSPGIEEARWAKPVRPNDRLSVHMQVLETRPSKSRPEMGLVKILSEVLNQRGEVVATARHVNMIGRRGTDWTHPLETPKKTEAEERAPDSAGRTADPVQVYGWFENIVPGVSLPLGTYLYEQEAMIRFARAYDPQFFHVDPEAAKKSQFGGLIASGWHTLGGYMKCLVETRQRAVEAAQSRGDEPAAAGPSPGFRNLRWLQPVHAGDRLAFTSIPTDKRATSRPGWGLVFAQNLGLKQDGTKALEFESITFYPMRESK